MWKGVRGVEDRYGGCKFYGMDIGDVHLLLTIPCKVITEQTIPFKFILVMKTARFMFKNSQKIHLNNCILHKIFWGLGHGYWNFPVFGKRNHSAPLLNASQLSMHD